MKSFSNTYIFVFSLVMVTFVSVLLSSVAMSLRPRQQMNVEIEKKEDILRSVDRAEDLSGVEDKNSFVNQQFNQFITESYVINYEGERIEADAFEVALHIEDEVEKPPRERRYPVFVYSGQGDTKNYVVPVRGKGLWGPIWGYVAFRSDMNTITGAVFDHQGETPGLGAEINTDWFQEKFEGKTIFNEEGEFVSVQVVKGGAPENDPHAVDAISGGTITSNGLQEMLKDCLEGYVRHFRQMSDELKS